VIHWVYRLSTFDFGTNLGYSLAVVGDVVVLALAGSVGAVGVVGVAVGVEIVASRSGVGGGAADGLPAHPVSSTATRASSAGNLA
jgi:hypothetical protein